MSEQLKGIDDSEWPLVHVDVDELTEAAGEDAVLDALNALLDRGERFALSFQGRRRQGARDRSHEWMMEREEALGRLIIGAAFIVAPATLARNRELAAGGNPYPFPVWPATTREECAEWLRGLMAEGAAAASCACGSSACGTSPCCTLRTTAHKPTISATASAPAIK